MDLESFFDRSKVSARHFTANDSWCPSDPISSVINETERPRSSRSSTDQLKVQGFVQFPDLGGLESLSSVGRNCEFTYTCTSI